MGVLIISIVVLWGLNWGHLFRETPTRGLNGQYCIEMFPAVRSPDIKRRGAKLHDFSLTCGYCGSVSVQKRLGVNAHVYNGPEMNSFRAQAVFRCEECLAIKGH